MNRILKRLENLFSTRAARRAKATAQQNHRAGATKSAENFDAGKAATKADATLTRDISSGELNNASTPSPGGTGAERPIAIPNAPASMGASTPPRAKSHVYRVLATQFLTAFADNAVLFTAITLVMQQLAVGDWYVPALQGAFLVAFVVFAPWVGRFADNRPKPRILFGANLVKAAGAGLLLIHVEALMAYAVIGLGAAIYSPAKYGILPELVDEQRLVSANGWIEASTIFAILGGTLAGAALAEYSIGLALTVVIACYGASAAIALSIAHRHVAGSTRGPALKAFRQQMATLLSTPRARFATLGVSLFWAAATVLRVLLVAWAPAVLAIHASTAIAQLTLFVALGIAAGAVLVPRLIPMAYLRRARLAAYAMGMVIVVLATLDTLWSVRGSLFLAGLCGGLFVVPINAALQEIGHLTIGSGRAVAIQNFFENLAMLLASGCYALVAAANVDPVATMIGLGLIVILAAIAVSWNLPKDTGALLPSIDNGKG